MWPIPMGAGLLWLPGVMVVLTALCVAFDIWADRADHARRPERGERGPARGPWGPGRSKWAVAVGWPVVAVLGGLAAYGEVSVLVPDVMGLPGTGYVLSVPDLNVDGPLEVGLLLAGLLATALPRLERAPRRWALPLVAVATGEALAVAYWATHQQGVQYLALVAVGVLLVGGLAGACVGRVATGRLAWAEGEIEARSGRWALLLPAVVVMVSYPVGLHLWQVPAPNTSAVAAVIGWVVGLALLAALFVALTRWPRGAADLAADLAALGLLGIGTYAVVQGVTNHNTIEVQVYGHPGGPPPELSLAIGEAHNLSVLGGIHGALLLALGLWLLPRTVLPDLRRYLTGQAPDPALTARVQVLTETRAEAVSSAAAELRRIERDLHDGAQGRLVAIGINLRNAEDLVTTSPDEATALIAEARQASAAALEELRDLVRGIYPPVLADRGLGEAVRALAMDLPMPCELDVDLPQERLDPPVESALYFAVAELVTNAIRHADARSLKIRAACTDGLLRVEVTDDGVGGADPARGSGLAGVERRLAAFDGMLTLSSPPGGPTTVVMEVPCA